MRLIKLRIKNIASLKQEHEINFAQIQQQSPLFAITGETGAGKSSILNSIGLVLYGKVYKSNVTQNDLVTLGEKEGQIELIFQAQGKNYLAFWKARIRKQNGELYSTPQTPQRELYTLEGEDFSSPKTILTTKIEELLNLDFDQFCKCIILNQGEFARFLSSSFTERKEILEKLYPGEMLESLSRALKGELDLYQKQKDDLDIELKTLNADGPQGEDLTALKTNLEENFKLHEGWLKTLEQIESHYSTFMSYHTKYHDSQSKIEAVKGSLSRDTSVFNELLLLSQRASEDLGQVQKEQEAQLPRLQELLKAEESLKNAQEMRAEALKNEARATEQAQALDKKHQDLQERLKLWTTRSEELLKSFSLPLQEIRTHQHAFDEVFDLFTHKELLRQELGKEEERLSQLEAQGKAEAQELKELQLKKTTFADDKKLLGVLELQRKELSAQVDQKQRGVIRQEELTKNVAELFTQEATQAQHTLALKEEILQLQQEFLPLETTLKLQSLLSAVEVCLTHPALEEKKECPVCKSSLSDEKIRALKSNLEKTDFTKLKAREAELNKKLIQRESELHQTVSGIEKLKSDLEARTQELSALASVIQKELPAVEDLDLKIKDAQKKVWEQEKILRDEERGALSLNKTREQYGSLKKEILARSELKLRQEARLVELTSQMSFVKELDLPTVTELKAEARKLTQYLDSEAQGEKLLQEKNHIEENLKVARENLEKAKLTLLDLNEKIASLTQTLGQELNGRMASELISHLSQRIKERTEFLTLKDRELKAQELKLKESQSRLYTLDELLKEIDLLFTKELHALKLLGQVEPSKLNGELDLLLQKLSGLSLDLTSPSDLFIPLKDLIDSQKTLFKEKTAELKMGLGSVTARLEDWEKRQDRITLLLLKSQDLIRNLERRSRLYEVLGKDELRTFVLSLVEENLITQTNDELQKLCQGRYEIIHQSKKMKLTPEFYILDKFREGGLRKVSTLSGGETFMVSLAMALGLAELTRGKAEIDSLFIDEGFGTLDQDSLEDVLDMLKQIQTRGLMVGIISHVKALTSALPVNLLVSKKQDGTSKLGIVYN